METIEQGLRRIFKNAPHIYAECVRCAKERPNMDWGKTYSLPISGSHKWGIHSYADSSGKYWEELDRKTNAGEQIGPDYPLPPDSPIRQKEVGNWYQFTNKSIYGFTTGKWYKCIRETYKSNAFMNDTCSKGGFNPNNHLKFDLSNPLPHNPETKPTLEDMEQKPEQAQKTETQIRLDREKFSFTRNGCLIELHIYYNNRDYKLLYHNKATQDNHETLLELQLEAVRFAKKRLNEATSTSLEQGKA